jgi:large repetitive protein
MKHIYSASLFIVIFLLFGSKQLSAQQPICDPAVPTFTVNLTGNPSATWISPFVVRNGNCCGTTAPDRCVRFDITLDPNAMGINFNIFSGAMPPGALFYQVNCGPPTPVGQPICLNGPGPHTITFCKPGNNNNQYIISSIPYPNMVDSVTVNDGCSKVLTSSGYNPSTITWNSIAPGSPGQYNSYLSCTSGCATSTVTGQTGAPSFIDYVVCGVPIVPCITTTVCDTVRVYFNPTLQVVIQPINPTVCFGATGTTITAVGSGGTPPYSFIWNTGATTSSIFVNTGTYSVVMQDNSDCPPTTASVTVTGFANPITANAGPDITVCATNPTVNLGGSVTGVTTGIWSGGGGTFSSSNTDLNASYTPSAAEIAAGSATLILTTTNNGTCPPGADTVQINITTFQSTINVTPSNIACSGGGNGSATANVSGPNAPFTYSWNTSPVQTGQTATNLPPGTYTVTVTDVNGCTGTESITITEPLPLTATFTQTNVSCFLGSDGSATVTAFGGTAPYSYSWSPSGGNGATASNLSSGTYTVTVTDANNCQVQQTITITQPTVIVGTISNIVHVQCHGDATGSATVNPNGGTPGYSFLWTPSGQTSQTATGLTAGAYVVTVTDANGCQAFANVTINQPANPLSLTISGTDIACNGASTGTATVVASGGTSGYTYLWTPGGATTATASGLTIGSYSVLVTDANGCTETTSITLTEPTPLQLSIGNVSPVSCFGGNNGSAEAVVSGGVGPHTYLWTPGNINTSTASGLAAGTYTVVVTDANGCTITDNVTITQPLAPLAVSFNTINNLCNGQSNGSITANVSGGTAGYSYLWYPNADTNQTNSGLPAGTYTLVITDANGCQLTDNATVTEPLAITYTYTSVNSTCNLANGSATVNPSGGTAPYTYLWSPGGQTTQTVSNIAANAYSVLITDNNGCFITAYVSLNDIAGPSAVIYFTQNVSCNGGNDGIASVSQVGGTPPYTYLWNTTPPQTGSTASGLSAGVYTVTVTDANGCVGAAVTDPAITEPPAYQIVATQTNVSCFGGNNGTATVSVTGGTPNYTYTWIPNVGNTSSVSGLSAGVYTVSISDQNSCDTTITFTITQPTQITLNTNVTNVSCFGGSNGAVTVTASQGTPGYSYVWSPNGATSATNNGLSAGTYTVIVTDANGCTANTSATVTQPLNALAVTATPSPVSCFNGSNGSVAANVTGGTPGYTYQWSPSGGTNSTASGLTAGAYIVTVTDNNGCTATSAIVTVTQPNALVVSITNQMDEYCNQANGQISAGATGGVTPYNYLWTPGNVPSNTISNIPAGTYTITVTDNNGCTVSQSATINNIPPGTASISATTHVSCFGGNNGTATASPAGGTPPYTYSWSPIGQTTAVATNLPAGSYTVTITDSKGCTATATAIITQPPLLLATISSSSNVSCNGGNNGTASVNPIGGTAPYTYSWNTSPIQTGATANNLAAGTYTVTVTDNNGCTTSTIATITQPSALTAGTVTTFNTTCFQSNDGTASVSPTGGTSPYTYSWNTTPVQASQTAFGLSPGNYTVTVTDNNGCTSQASGTITQPTPVVTTAGNDGWICIGNSINISASASGGSGNYYYIWNPGFTVGNPINVSPQVTTTYTVTAYDLNGCPGNVDSLVVVVSSLTNNNIAAMATSPICPGSSSMVYLQTYGVSADSLTISWNQGLGTGPGAFQVFPTSPTTYIVTVSNSCAVTITDTVEVEFHPLPSVNIMVEPKEGCAPLNVSFYDASTSQDPIVAWYWSFGDGGVSNSQNPTHTYTEVGSFNVSLSVVTSNNCAVTSGTSGDVVTVYPNPDASFTVSPTTVMVPNNPVFTTNTSQGAVSYVWNFGDGNTSTAVAPQHMYTTVGTFQIMLIAQNQYGCLDTAYNEIIAKSNLVFPNAFTPNAGGPNGGAYSQSSLDNNVFFPFTAGIDEFHMMVFNRWGELIFETHDINIGWDGYYRGNLCQQDVYVYKARARLIDGEVYEKVGDVTLLR